MGPSGRSSWIFMLIFNTSKILTMGWGYLFKKECSEKLPSLTLSSYSPSHYPVIFSSCHISPSEILDLLFTSLISFLDCRPFESSNWACNADCPSVSTWSYVEWSIRLPVGWMVRQYGVDGLWYGQRASVAKMHCPQSTCRVLRQ